MANTISVSVLGDVRDINKKLGNVEKQIGGFGKKVSGMGKALAGGLAAVGAAQVFKDVISGASDAQQSLGATETVFGKFANTVIKTSESAAAKYGLSANEYRENANLIGSLFKNQGVSMDQLGGKTETMIGKASDLAATFGGDTKTAVEALSSAFKGEFDSLEKYGISLKQSTVSAEAMRVANVKSAKEWNGLTLAQQRAATQQATTNLINQQSADSTGAFAKETNTLAHQQQVLAAKVQNAKDKVGSALLPVLTQLASFVSDTVLPALERFGAWFSANALPKIKEFGAAFGEAVIPKLQVFGTFLTGTVVPALQSLGIWLAQNQAWLMPLAVGIGAVVVAWKAWTVATKAWAAVTKAAAAVQAAFNVVMAMNPIGLLVLAIVGLVAALVYAWKTNAKFRATVIAAWNAIKSGASKVFGWLKSFVTGTFSAIKNAFLRFTPLGIIISHFGRIRSFVSGAINGVKGAWNSAWNTMKSLLSRVMSGIRSAISSGINNVMSTVRGIRGRILGALSGAGSWLVSTGRSIISGLISGISNMAGSVASKAREVVQGAISAARNALKINSPSKVFRSMGYSVGEGLIMGIDRMGVKTARATAALAGKAIDGFGSPTLSLAGASGAGIGGTTQVTIQVNVPATADKAAIGREVAGALDAYYAQGGRRRA